MQSKQGVRGNSHNDYTHHCMLRYDLSILFAKAYEHSMVSLFEFAHFAINYKPHYHVNIR